MVFEVEMLAFQGGIIREVDVPDEVFYELESVMDVLEKVFHYGQNDFQPVEGRYSVSVGDVIRIDDPRGITRWRVANFGFNKLTRRKETLLDSLVPSI